MYKHKKFHLVLDVFKLRDSDDEKVRDLNAKSAERTASSRSTPRMYTSKKVSGSFATC